MSAVLAPRKTHSAAYWRYSMARSLFRLAYSAPQRPHTVETGYGWRRDERRPNNELRDQAEAWASKADPRAISFLARREEAPLESCLRARFHASNPRMREVVGGKWVDAGYPNRRYALAQLRFACLSYRGANRRYLYGFDTSGYRLLDAQAKRIAATRASREAEAQMLDMAQRCVNRMDEARAAYAQAVAA